MNSCWGSPLSPGPADRVRFQSCLRRAVPGPERLRGVAPSVPDGRAAGTLPLDVNGVGWSAETTTLASHPISDQPGAPPPALPAGCMLQRTSFHGHRGESLGTGRTATLARNSAAVRGTRSRTEGHPPSLRGTPPVGTPDRRGHPTSRSETHRCSSGDGSGARRRPGSEAVPSVRRKPVGTLLQPSPLPCRHDGIQPPKDDALEGSSGEGTALSQLGERGRNATAGLRRYLEPLGVNYVPVATNLERRAISILEQAGYAMRRQVDSGGEHWDGRVDLRHETGWSRTASPSSRCGRTRSGTARGRSRPASVRGCGRSASAQSRRSGSWEVIHSHNGWNWNAPATSPPTWR